MTVGNNVTRWRIPTFANGQLQYLPLTQFQGKPLVLCCLPSLTNANGSFLDSQAIRFSERGAVLAILLYCDSFSKDFLVWNPTLVRIPLLTDPLKRLSRALDLFPQLPPKRCETLIFDAQCHLEFRLLHDLAFRGFTNVLEVIGGDNRRGAEPKPIGPMFQADFLQSHP